MLLTPGAGSLRLASDEAHCWYASLEVPRDASVRFYATLSAAERDRTARLRFRLDQQRFIASHGVLRELLSRYLGVSPGRIRYRYNAFGKPDLSHEFGTRLKFNLSHSAGLAVIAVAPESEVGVDLECIQAGYDYRAIARCFFSPAEAAQLDALPPDPYANAFVSYWTKKEACLKGCGGGLSIPLSRVVVRPSDRPERNPVRLHVPSHDHVPATNWSVYTLRPVPGYVGALAIPGKGWHLAEWEWRT